MPRYVWLVMVLTLSMVPLPLLAQAQGESREALDALDEALGAKPTPQNIPAPVEQEKPGTPDLRELLAETDKSPQNPENWTKLGNYYFDHDRPEESIAAYERSLALKPDNPDVIVDMGVMHHASGRPEIAITCFDKALALNPRHAIARMNKGLVLIFDMRKNAEGVAVLEELLRLDPQAKDFKGKPIQELLDEVKKSSGFINKP